MTATHRPVFERQRYWQGQRLRSRDANDQLAVANEMRWWHNRALHNAYGVIHGLRVTATAADGLNVSPGLAYDCYGRELILGAAKIIQPPNVPEKRMLIIRYRATANTTAVDRLQARAVEAADLVWKPPATFHFTDGVPLAEVQGGDLLLFNAPLARPLSRPLIAHGKTVLGKTDWLAWVWPEKQVSIASIGIIGNESGHIGTEVIIDTAAAGFTDIPCYFASLHSRQGLWSQAEQGVIPILVDRIMDARPERFTFSLWFNLASLPIIRRRLSLFNNRWLLNLARQNLYVSWLGIQMPPVIDRMSDRMIEVENGLS